MLIQGNQITKGFGGRILLENLDIHVTAEQKIALIGQNGTGKTTLLNILMGLDNDFGGSLQMSKQCRIGYLSQGVNLSKDHTLFEECLSHYSDLLKIENQISEIEILMSQRPDDLSIQEKYGSLRHEFEEKDGYNIENKVKQILTGLGFPEKDWHRSIGTMSGGEQRRGFFAKLLLGDYNLLILDEPTNHLDIFSIKWLEGFLREYKGALLMVSHDQTFINGIVTETYELIDKKIEKYAGNYNYYLIEKQRRYEAQLKAYELQQEEIKRTEDFINRNIAGQKTKQAQSRRKSLEKMDVIQRPKKTLEIRFQIPPPISSHNNFLKIKSLSKSHGDKVILNNLSFNLEKGNKLALVGRNGSGKTTLIKEILNTNSDDSHIQKNNQILLSYFSQGSTEMDNEDTVFDFIHNENTKFTHQQIRDQLAIFQFRGDDIDKKIGMLSGGEKTRLAILKTIIKPTDLLILDEPTNHLDLSMRNILATALRNYSGTILVVSHDRHFLDEFIDRVFLLVDAKGYFWTGNYTENEDKIVEVVKGIRRDDKLQSNTDNQSSQKKKNVNMFKVQKIEKQISLLEDKIQSLTTQMHDESVYSNFEELKKVEEQLSHSKHQLEDFYNQWEDLHSASE